MNKAQKAIVGFGVGLAAAGAGLFFAHKKGMLKGTLGYVRARTRKNGMMLEEHYDPIMSINKRVGYAQKLVEDGVHDPQMMQLARAITGSRDQEIQLGNQTLFVKGARCAARDVDCEIRAIGNWVHQNVRYTGDVAPIVLSDGRYEAIDFFSSGKRSAEMGGEDCLPAGTLLLNDKMELVPIEELVIGSRIWGRDRWSVVQDAWYKGVKPIDVVQLNNGSSFRATADHKVFVGQCLRHDARSDGRGCACPLNEREIVRLRVGDLQPGMVLVTPERIAYGDEQLDARRAMIEGFYLSDGWSSHDSRFDIAGRDGKPKEAQKRLIEEMCHDLGVRTSWHEKHISVLDPEWAARMKLMGGHAPEKHALSINLQEAAAKALLQGIMADSDVRDHHFTTTSRRLALQVRLLHKMAGITCGESYIVDHGGLGGNPIWRLYPRLAASEGRFSSKKMLRVRGVDHGVIEQPVYDLTTDDHYVYLPEADVTVSNCDGHSILNATLLTLNGITSMFRITAPKGSLEWGHIYALAGLPKENPTRYTAVDTTLPGFRVGVEAPYSRNRDFRA